MNKKNLWIEGTCKTKTEFIELHTKAKIKKKSKVKKWKMKTIHEYSLKKKFVSRSAQKISRNSRIWNELVFLRLFNLLQKKERLKHSTDQEKNSQAIDYHYEQHLISILPIRSFSVSNNICVRKAICIRRPQFDHHHSQ